ncbi:MAG TPA: hypothetical protein VGJ55_09920 [Pyrinomonadaceae bacterium]|jgi:hypothetical protein
MLTGKPAGNIFSDSNNLVFFRQSATVSPTGNVVNTFDLIDVVNRNYVTDFKSDQIFWFDFSRDGQLALSRGTQTSDVILIRDFR